ncbi:MAG: hypothetical protein R3C49_18880 [Planctomycetaceae bacterium]
MKTEFLSPYGIRSLSKVHEKNPFVLYAGGQEHRVSYIPGESDSWMFGGNSNWRGPIWFPMNYLLVEALERYHRFYGDSLKVECPTGSGNMMNLAEVAQELMRPAGQPVSAGKSGRRPCHGDDKRFQKDPHWKDLILFYEYFHGETGRGLGASHQTGWTALAARMLEKLHQIPITRSAIVAPRSARSAPNCPGRHADSQSRRLRNKNEHSAEHREIQAEQPLWHLAPRGQPPSPHPSKKNRPSSSKNKCCSRYNICFSRLRERRFRDNDVAATERNVLAAQRPVHCVRRR